MDIISIEEWKSKDHFIWFINTKTNLKAGLIENDVENKQIVLTMRWKSNKYNHRIIYKYTELWMLTSLGIRAVWQIWIKMSCVFPEWLDWYDYIKKTNWNMELHKIIWESQELVITKWLHEPVKIYSRGQFYRASPEERKNLVLSYAMNRFLNTPTSNLFVLIDDIWFLDTKN